MGPKFKVGELVQTKSNPVYRGRVLQVKGQTDRRYCIETPPDYIGWFRESDLTPADTEEKKE